MEEKEMKVQKESLMEMPEISEGASVASCSICPGSQVSWGFAITLPVCSIVNAAV